MKNLKLPAIAASFLALIVFVSAKPETHARRAKKKPLVSKYYAHLAWHSNGFGSQDFYVYLTSTSSWTDTKDTALNNIDFYATMTVGGYSNPVEIIEYSGSTYGYFHGNLQEDLQSFTLSNVYTDPTTNGGVTIDCSDTTPHSF